MKQGKQNFTGLGSPGIQTVKSPLPSRLAPIPPILKNLTIRTKIKLSKSV
jgi:hypothetical protein